MTDCFTSEELALIQKGIREKYQMTANSPEGGFQYPTGRRGMEELKYETDWVDKLPGSVRESYCGVGNPFSLGPIHPGESVLDIGCGGGVDTLLAGILVGPNGKAVGLEMVPEMLARAEKNLAETDLNNVEFFEGSADRLPFSSDRFDVVLSNGVFNLIPDKRAALSEVYRVLKPGGRMMMADQVLTGPINMDHESRVKSWFR